MIIMIWPPDVIFDEDFKLVTFYLSTFELKSDSWPYPDYGYFPANNIFPFLYLKLESNLELNLCFNITFVLTNLTYRKY